MNYSKVRNEHVLTDITRDEIKFTNLAAIDNGSVYFNPRNHDLQLWATVPELIDNLVHEGVKIRTKTVGENNGEAEERPFIKLRAYPKVRVYTAQDGSEQSYVSPKMTLRYPDGTDVDIKPETINLIDEAVVDNNMVSMGISFHTFEENRFHTMVCNIDEILVLIDNPSVVGNRPSRDGNAGEPRSFLSGFYNK